MRDLKKKTVTGAAWMVGMRLAQNVLGLSSTVILVRLLTPEDFGLVALAGSAYAFLSVLGQFGFDIALIQLKDAKPAHYNTAWTANILVGLCVGVGTALIAKPAALFFDHPKIENVIYCFALLSFAKGFENIGIVNFRKTLSFRGEFFYFVLPKVASLLVGVTAAFFLRSYWALIIGMAASQITGNLYSHFAQPYRPRLSLEKFGELFQFTQWVLGINLLRFLSKNGLDIILGRVRDASSVGIFGIARQIAYLPTSEILAPINRVLFPSFSTISHNTEQLRAVFYKIFGVTTLLAFPAAFGILAISASLVNVVFGKRWTDVGPVLSVLGFIGALDALLSLTGPLLLARGSPKVLTYYQILYVAVLLPTTAVAAHYYGSTGVAYALLFAAVVSMPLLFVNVRREIGIELGGILRCSWRPIVASVAMALLVHELQTALVADSGATLLQLLLLVAAGAALYPAILLLLWRLSGRPDGAENVLLEMWRSRIASPRGGWRALAGTVFSQLR